MAEEISVADDLLRNGYDRWFRLEEEKAAIGEDLKELFAELKAHGFTPKALRESFRRVRNINDTDQQEHDAIVDLYVASLTGARPAHTRVENIEEFDAETGEITEPQDHDADPSPAQMSVTSDVIAVGGEGVTSLAGAEGIADQQPITEPQPSPKAGRDLTSSSPQGQVAPHPETINPVSAGPEDSGAIGQVAGKTAEASASAAPAPIYAAPGIVTEEHTPPEPVKRHPISAAFAELGQDSEGLRKSIAKSFGGVNEPIVKIGPEILDGWARYNAARSLHIDYPVVQYAGADLLADAIAWNIASRKLTQGHISAVISRLVKLYPDREQEIIGMFHAEYAEAAE